MFYTWYDLYDGYQKGLNSMVHRCFDKKSASFANKSAEDSGIKPMSNQ